MEVGKYYKGVKILAGIFTSRYAFTGPYTARISLCDTNKHLFPISKQINEIINQVVKAKSILNSAGIQSSFQIEKNDWIESGLKSQEFFSRIPCYIGWVLCLISANGNMYPCCGCSKKMGNVKEKSIKEIWYSKNYNQFRYDAKKIPQRKKPISNCRCFNCGHMYEILPIYNRIHSLKKVDIHGNLI